MGLGGAETMVMNLYRAVDRQRVQFDFLVFGDLRGAYEEEIEALGGRMIRMPAPSAVGVPRALRQMSTLMRSQGPYAAVHSHVNFASGLALTAAKIADAVPWLADKHPKIFPIPLAGEQVHVFLALLYFASAISMWLNRPKAITSLKMGLSVSPPPLHVRSLGIERHCATGELCPTNLCPNARCVYATEREQGEI